MLAIAVGILLMIEKKDVKEQKTAKTGSWLLYAAGSAFFASLTAILGKVGISGVESNLGTAIRTAVVLVMAWAMVFVTGKQKEVRKIERKELFFICCSGIATGASWLCYYRALQEGPASVVAPIDKLSVLVTVAFSYFVFGEKLSRRALLGIVLLTAGTVAMAVLVLSLSLLQLLQCFHVLILILIFANLSLVKCQCRRRFNCRAREL